MGSDMIQRNHLHAKPIRVLFIDEGYHVRFCRSWRICVCKNLFDAKTKQMRHEGVYDISLKFFRFSTLKIDLLAQAC